MWPARAIAVVLLPFGVWSKNAQQQGKPLPSWSSPWSIFNPGSHPAEKTLHAVVDGDEGKASQNVAAALGVEDPILRGAAMYEASNHYLETIVMNVAEKVKCQLCLRAGEEFAHRTLKIKDEVALIDETANICRGTDQKDDGGWIGDLQDEGWEIHNASLVQVVNETDRVMSKSQKMLQAWIFRRACYVVFFDGFEFSEMAEWLADYLLKHEKEEKVDTYKAQNKLCLQMTPHCEGVRVKKRERIAVPVPKKAIKKEMDIAGYTPGEGLQREYETTDGTITDEELAALQSEINDEDREEPRSEL